MKHFGYLLSDEQFIIQKAWLINFTKQWIKNKERNISLIDLIKNVFQNCYQRIPTNDIANFIIALFNIKDYYLSNIACELICYVKIKELSKEQQLAIAQCLEKLISDDNARKNLTAFRNAIIIFAINTTIDKTSLENGLKIHMESFYNNEFHLELYDKDRDVILKHITAYVQSIKKRADQQGTNGHYIGYADNPFDTIGNIITISKINLNWSEIQPILSAVSDFILSPNQSCGEKCQAITLLTTLVLTHPNIKSVKKFINDILSKKDAIFNVFAYNIFNTTDIPTLSVALDYLGMLVGAVSPLAMISSLSNILAMNDRDIIASMKYLSTSLEKTELNKLPTEVLSSVLQLSISLLSNAERDIRFLAVKCLIELTNSTYQELALKQLSLCMDLGSSDIRIAIISRIKKIQDDSSVRNLIVQKALTDNHYLIRKIAEETQVN